MSEAVVNGSSVLHLPREKPLLSEAAQGIAAANDDDDRTPASMQNKPIAAVNDDDDRIPASMQNASKH